MRGKLHLLNDRYTFNTALVGNMADELFKAALTAMLLMLKPEALQKEKDVFKAAMTVVSPMKRNTRMIPTLHTRPKVAAYVERWTPH